MDQQLTGKEFWDNTKELLGNHKVVFGSQGSSILHNDPKKMSSILSRYKFAAKMACNNVKVLELGCGEGLGSPILAEHSTGYLGVDKDSSLIQAAANNFQKYTFLPEDFLGKNYGSFGAVISLHVSDNPLFFQTMMGNLSQDGIVVLSANEKTVLEMKKYFYQVFSFGISDEIVHTGFSHDIICVGCHARG